MFPSGMWNNLFPLGPLRLPELNSFRYLSEKKLVESFTKQTFVCLL